MDRGDQLRHYYQLRLKSRKVYKYIFWFLVDVSIANTFVLHQNNTSTSTSLSPFKAFRLELAKGLIGDYNRRKRAAPTAAPVVPRPRRPTSLAHFPLRRPTGNKKGIARCWYSSHIRRPPLRRETMWYCGECDLYLCHTGVRETDCFMAHHDALLHRPTLS